MPNYYSIALMKFSTIGVGEAAIHAMQESLASFTNINITHPNIEEEQPLATLVQEAIDISECFIGKGRAMGACEGKW